MKSICKGYSPLINFLMENVTLLKGNDFTPSQEFFINLNFSKWILTVKNISKEHLQ